ncbi:LysR family transcriptional regulator [Verminephrobacter eiseniae]|uniref:Transcriptional regulator, LysR family n=1 Tax=Verminephrobacter eiseniae (strain EF01-2) TaxID=391735 RepID=A1WNJ8_VEREI|nr:LysR family transcriptional regulator [Verminephrobacter eiseniae]ABM59205.1 transcriptional regulator, LysR family [Verminephrobacter eiseniae EF01-2]MCW5284745.1 LysR family transcriptional regulator [Verminephrobacter eiseniae]MCW5302451.1 LysR family transcriptional regulator [Verminephrobacter eiseniae]MCW8178500.1 LysR family transcriptional regulator [Verminephrobacter eiseniae]MCW8189272.1 LysR family transcriptional regulator [Verminephrobacter eiseniae]
MSIRELESLVAIADSGSITAAAERLFLSVPAVSAQIASLEAALGTPMLDRRYKPARLNPAGTLLCERARAVLNSYRQFYETVANTADLAGVLAVGASPTVLTTVIPKTLVALRSAHPRIQIRMQYGRAWNLLKDLQHGQIDALIISQPPVSMGNTQWTQFAQEPVTVIAPPGAKGRNDESLLAEYPYIRFGQRFWVADTIAAHLAERGIVPQQIMQADSREAIALMVRHGLGVSIVPESDPPLSKLYGLREVALGKPPLTRNIGLAQTPGNPKQALIDALLHGLTEATVSSRMKPAPSRSLGGT